MTPSKVHRFVSNDFTVRAAAVDATQVVREMQQLQATLPIPTVAVGRAMVGAILMASNLKEGSVGLYFKGYGTLAAVYAEAHNDGAVRGYTPVPLYAPSTYEGGLSLKNHFNGGTLTVSRHQPFQKQPFQGTVAMVSGEIGDDIAHYLLQSQQIRSLIAVGVYLDTYGKVESAGGVLIEVMPGVDEEVALKIEKNSQNFKISISEMIKQGKSPIDLVAPYFEGIPFTQLDHDFPLIYSCPCTHERVIRALEMLGQDELQDMLDKKEKAEVQCQMCGKPYEIGLEEMQTLKDKLHRDSLH